MMQKSGMAGALGVGLLLAMILGPLSASAADIRDTGRQVAKQYGSAIVTVRMVLAISRGGRDNEVKGEISGTVISPSGLTMVPLSAIDPASMIERMTGGDETEFRFESKVKDIRLVVNKEKEIPAQVVLRDKDLDVAFLRPREKPDKPLVYVDLTQAVEAQLLEQVVVLARTGKASDREIAVMTGEVQAIVNKPRRFYIPSAELASGGFGVPIFNADAKVVGVVLMRAVSGGEDSNIPFAGGGDNNVEVIVLPASDINEIAQQAPEKAPKEEQAPATQPATEPSEKEPAEKAPAEKDPTEAPPAGSPPTEASPVS